MFSHSRISVMNERRKGPRGAFVLFKLFALKISASKSRKADVVRVTKKISSQLRQGKWRQALLSLERMISMMKCRRVVFICFPPARWGSLDLMTDFPAFSLLLLVLNR